MRYVKVLLLVLVFVVSMVFFVQNTETLGQKLVLTLDLPGLSLTSVGLPVYLITLLAFLLGALFSLAYFLLEMLRLSGQLRACRGRIAAIEEEVNSLRNLPLEDHSLTGTPPQSAP
jgi:putative membrane protein